MKKILWTLLAASLLIVGYWLISPLFIDREVSERLEDIMSKAEELPPSPAPSGNGADQPAISGKPEVLPQSIASGAFTGLAGHSGEGTASLLRLEGKYYIRFEDDFRVTNGPDLFVHFGSNNSYDSGARISPLKGNIGGQNYEIPEGIDPEKYDEIWIWCRAFAVPFAKAVLEKA
jgi:hypothetical protein